jgi:tetraprenyl-beta-curcumene synthase
MDIWRRYALTIPDPFIREDALDSLSRKRTHADGAALFWILPRRRHAHLLKLLVTYEIMWDFLDNVSERGAHIGQANGRALYSALIDALDTEAELTDHYRFHPWKDDGRYLQSLIEACREGCKSLPAYPQVRGLLRRETSRALVLGLNHDPDPHSRDTALQQWAQDEYPGCEEASWFELASAASASLTVHAVLALAAEYPCRQDDVEEVYGAYFPWVSALGTMLDSFVDQAEDVEAGNHIYVDHYPGDEIGLRRIGELVHRSAHEAARLRNGHRHAVIVSCMTAMYLSKDSARTPDMRARTRGLVREGGSLARLLHPILRMWRIAYELRSA